MPQDIVKSIAAAEAQAQEERRKAAEQAREIIAAAQEACLAKEKESLALAREKAGEYQKERAQQTAQYVKSLDHRLDQHIEAINKAADVKDAARHIFERIVNDGNL